MKIRRIAACTVVLAALTIQSTNAQTRNYVEVTDTPDEWYVTFTGNGFGFIGAGGGSPTSAYWQGDQERVARGAGSPKDFDWSWVMKHLEGGGGPDLAPSLTGDYGTTQTDFVTLPHGSAFDTFELTLTVQQGEPVPNLPGEFFWGDISGSWHAIHRGVNSVPDAASTFALLSGAMTLLGFVARRK